MRVENNLCLLHIQQLVQPRRSSPPLKVLNLRLLNSKTQRMVPFGYRNGILSSFSSCDIDKNVLLDGLYLAARINNFTANPICNYFEDSSKCHLIPFACLNCFWEIEAALSVGVAVRSQGKRVDYEIHSYPDYFDRLLCARACSPISTVATRLGLICLLVAECSWQLHTFLILYVKIIWTQYVLVLTLLLAAGYR